MQWTEQTTDGLVLAIIIVVGLLIVREFYERQIRCYDVNVVTWAIVEFRDRIGG